MCNKDCLGIIYKLSYLVSELRAVRERKQWPLFVKVMKWWQLTRKFTDKGWELKGHRIYSASKAEEITKI